MRNLLFGLMAFLMAFLSGILWAVAFLLYNAPDGGFDAPMLVAAFGSFAAAGLSWFFMPLEKGAWRHTGGAQQLNRRPKARTHVGTRDGAVAPGNERWWEDYQWKG